LAPCMLYGMQKSLRSMNEDTSKAKFIISFAKFLLICCWMTVGRIAREL
jgi:hypothetical protein